jgi:hypothetical protein
MLLKRILTLVTLLLTLSGAATAQTSADAGVAAGIVIRTSPPGAEVVLEGDAVVTGITPATIRYPLIGPYKLTIKRSGYEKYKSDLVLNPSQQLQLDISLSRKTPIKAAVRSMFLPGWGQNYSEQKTKAFAFTMLFAGAVTTYFIADHRFDDKEETFLTRQREYDDAVTDGASYTELSRRLDAENVRRIGIGLVVGVWGLNVLDALFFTPTDKAVVTVKGISVAPSTEPDQFGIQLTKSF